MQATVKIYQVKLMKMLLQSIISTVTYEMELDAVITQYGSQTVMCAARDSSSDGKTL